MAVPTRVKDVQQNLGFRSLEAAYRDGKNLSRWLEQQDPSKDYKDDSKLGKMDAFERQIYALGVVTSTSPERGFYADELRTFEEHGEAGYALMVEWMSRQYRKVAHQSRSILGSDQNTLGSMMRPYVEAAQARSTQLAPAIPIDELIAFTTQIDSNAYRALYLNDDENEYRMVRVGETAEIPSAKLTQGERPVDLYKYGRRLDISYEALRRTPIDTVAFYIARMAIQAEVDKVSTVLDVIVNGDGNAGTAAEVHNLTTLDPATTAGTLTVAGWLAFKLKFKNPYTLTHELVREDVALKQLLLDMGSSNTRLADLAGTFGGLEPMNPVFRDNVRYGVLDEAPADQIVAVDSRFTLERITEIGGTINETKKWVEKQVDSLVFTEVEGYAVVDSKGAKILDLGA